MLLLFVFICFFSLFSFFWLQALYLVCYFFFLMIYRLKSFCLKSWTGFCYEAFLDAPPPSPFWLSKLRLTVETPVLARLRSKPRGAEVAVKLSLTLLKSQGKRASKPVLVVQGGGRFWLGIISPRVSRSRSRHQHAVAYLDRCFAKE